MKALERAIRLHWYSRHPERSYEWKTNQRGGGYGVINVGGHDIHYREHIDGDILIVYGGVDALHSTPCFDVHLDYVTKHAYLQTVNKRSNGERLSSDSRTVVTTESCFDDDHQNSRDIVRGVYKLVQQYGMEKLEFRDESVIYCPEERLTPGSRTAVSAEVLLADLSFLTTGRTWYESIIPNLVCMNCPNLERYRNTVYTNTWRTVGANIKGLQTNGVDIDAPGSAMAVLNLMKKSEKYCAFFSENMELLREWSGIQTLQGKSWYCDIPPLVSRLRQTLKASSRRGGRRRCAPSKRRK